ncbi:proteophosphoglycan ppg4 [Ophiostoma piceae UAMH 11346]|uniref:Proteophosphoglycan ppg4 n=1 Tax=Ophiostoma piceae (strain UAMH 11346) TaxID=1262450 RepID=S3CQ73_OPHP1|nr:proteophosphoglycan ppg4 [Ophiostoma piceae UAMH 11346]
MGNQPSSEAYRGAPLSPRPPADRPLPPLPRPLPVDDHPYAKAHTSYSHPSARTSTLTSLYASAPTNKLSKPRHRAHSAAGLTQNSDGLAKSVAPGRFSTSSFANLVSTFSHKSPSSSTFAAKKSPHPLTSRPSSSSLSAKNAGAQSPSVFTFEEAVAAFTGHREPAAWRPLTDIYPTPSLDLELLQEQQARQLEFEERQRLNLIQRQKRLSRSKPQKQLQELQPQEHLEFDFQLDKVGIETLVSDPTLDFDFEEKPVEREPRKLQRQIQKDKLQRRSFFRSSSSQRTARPENGFGDLDAGYHRRNSIGSVYSYSAGRHTWDFGSMAHDPQHKSQHHGGPMENWPPAAGTRTSWNYDMSSYAAKRLLHVVVDNNDPVDHRYEQSSVTSESRQSTLSEVTWKSSHPVQDENPALKRANSDLSLFAPVRRTSMMNIPGVATRRNSTSSFVNAANAAASSRPSFRHSHTAPQVPSTPPSLSRSASNESIHNYGLSMPVLKRPIAIIRGADESAARVSTPTDHDKIRYSTIGAYKLGSLRITNGAASPASPEPRKPRTVELDGDSPVRSPDFECKARSMALAALSGNTPTEETGGVPNFSSSDITKPKIKLSPSLLQLSFDIFSPGQPAPEPVKTPIEPPQVELPDDLFAGFEFSSFSFEDTVTVEVPTAVEPWERPNTAASTLQTTSKTTAMEDLLFEEDDHSTLGYSTAEVLDVRLDPSAKAAVKRGRAGILASRKSIHSVQSVSRSDSGLVSSPTSETSHKPLSKADSGYSSNVSLRSIKQAASKLMAPVAKAANRLSSDRDSSRAPERESFIIDELTLPCPTFDASDINFHPASASPSPPSQRRPMPVAALSYAPPSPPIREAPAPPAPATAEEQEPPETPPKDDYLLPPISISATTPSTPAVSEPPAPRLVRSSTSPARMNKKRYIPPTPIDIARFGHGSRSDSREASRPSPNPLTPGSIQSNGSASALSIGSGTQRPNKLLRFLSFNNSSTSAAHKGPPAVHATHIDEDYDADVPAVPSVVNDKLHEHAGRFPITTKRLTLRSQLSNNTLKTIFSVGSLENRGSNADLRASSLRDGSSRTGSRLSMHRDLATDGTSKRKSRLSMAVDFIDEPEVDEEPERKHYRSKTFTSSRLADVQAESKAKKSRVSWRHREKENVQTQTIETGHSLNNEPAVNNSDDKTRSRSSSLMIRTMSMTAQFERTMSMKLSFPRLSSRFYSHDNNTTAAAAEPPAAPPVPSIVRTSMTSEAEAAPKPPINARTQQIPSVLRAPPPLRSKSTPPTEAGSKSVWHESNRESLYAATATQSIKPPVDPRWEVKTDHDISKAPDRRMSESLDRRGSVDSASRAYDGPYVPHRSFPGDTSLCAQFAATETREQPQFQFYESQDEQPQSRVIRYRASYDGYSSVSVQADPPSMSNGYTAPDSSSGGGDSGGDTYQLEQQQACDYYYQQHTSPPSAHSRNQSTGSRHGPKPGPQAQYRVLHSYNSPAYRGVPIWG